MKYLSIVIPAYNEVHRLPETLALVKDFVESKSYDCEVLVVDDGSKDDTVAIAQKYAKRFPALRVITNQKNKGKGGVVKQGMLQAEGQYRLFTDADNSTPISELEKLLAFTPEYSIIIGSRYLQADSIKVKQPFKRQVVSRLSNLAIQTLLLPGIRDTQCGFKLFSAQATEDIFSRQIKKGWSFDIELLTIAKQRGYKIKEVPVDWFDAKRSTFHASKEAGAFVEDLLDIYRRSRNGEYEQ